ncbi:MAG: hypothetical protein R2942_06385 [Ignavibacteria bacterium]
MNSLEYLAKISENQTIYFYSGFVYPEIEELFLKWAFVSHQFQFQMLSRHFLNNNEAISEDLKSGLINYLKYYKILLSLKEKYNFEKSFKILNEIKRTPKLRNKEWLLEKYRSF